MAQDASAAGGLDPSDFRMVDVVGRAELALHPVWSDYQEEEDRPLLLSQGVPAARLDAELERLAHCGVTPKYPVLDPDPLPGRPNLIVAVELTTAGGRRLPGYVMGELVFGAFPPGATVSFNRSLPGLCADAEARLAGALSVPPETLFPIRYRGAVRDPRGAPLEGRIERFW